MFLHSVGVLIATLCAENRHPPSDRTLPERVTVGAFSVSYLNPPELQFGCWVSVNEVEDLCAKTLTDATADPAARLAVAQALWRGRSRRYAVEVLRYAAGPPPGGEPFRRFQRETDAGVRPDAVLQHLRDGDYLWGSWLAFLRPHPSYVPVLLDALKEPLRDRPWTQMALRDDGVRSETLLALGNSGDRRALAPLLDRLRSKDYRVPGEAAQALGYLGLPEAEPALIAALAADNNWRQVHACGALARMGTRAALPALEKLAADDRETGVLNVQGMAREAVEQIRKRGGR